MQTKQQQPVRVLLTYEAEGCEQPLVLGEIRDRGAVVAAAKALLDETREEETGDVVLDEFGRADSEFLRRVLTRLVPELSTQPNLAHCRVM